MKKRRGIAVLTAAVTILAGSLTASAKAVSDYTDVQPGHWYYSYVSDVSERGLMTGLNATYFGTGETLARAQVATILYRMAGSPQTEYSSIFPDVPAGQFYSDAVLWANQNGIVTGYTDTGIFGPSNSITRQELAVMMYRYAQLEGKPVDAAGDLAKFPDSRWLSSYAYWGVSWATGIGLIQGMGTDGSLNPQGEISRAECATILSRYFSLWHEPVYEQVKVVDQQAYTEYVYEDKLVCGCGGIFSTYKEWENHWLNDDCIYGYSVKPVVVDEIQHEEVWHWEQQVVQEGYWG